VKPLVSHLPRATFAVVVLLLLVGTLAAVGGAAQAGSTPSYTLTGYARQPGGPSAPPVPAGVSVDLLSRATGAVYVSTTFGTGGQFNFTSSGTSGALGPGYWSVYIPAQTNLSLGPTCTPCGILPVNQSPTYAFYNVSALTTTLYPTSLTNIGVFAYNSMLRGVVKSSGVPEAGATVQLLATGYNNVQLVNNTTASDGSYSLKVPIGTWVLKTAVPGPTTYYNFSKVTIASRATVWDNVSVQPYLASGYEYQLASPSAQVPNGGNVTVWDGYNGAIYSSPTPGGGFYSFGTYPGNFSSTTQSQYFQVVLSPIGYQTMWYPLTVASPPTPYTRNVWFPTLTPTQKGIFQTTLNLGTINVSKGTGNVTVTTLASLGNDTVFPNLPNASIGQLWAQLGLDFDHSTTFSASSLSAFYQWENQSGPFFPAVQAGLAINGTGFLGPSTPQTLTNESSTCTTTCGLSDSKRISLGWSETYKLNGTVARNSGAYTLSFGFQHSPSADTFNYSVILPAGYVLAAGTSAPAGTKLVPNGLDNTWTKFTLVSLPSKTAQGQASFSIVKYANLTANVNVSTSDFAFSKANVLNATHGNYTVVVGVGENATFSALNSTYPAGTNGTKFVWNFGDGGMTTTGQATTNHTYAVASGTTPYSGTLTVTSSGGLVNSTTFYVWVAQGPVTAVISTNASASQNRTINGHPYVFVNWGTVLYLNASLSSASVSPSAPIPGVRSVAYFQLAAKGFKLTQNYSVSLGASFESNFSYQYLGAGVYYSSSTTINGSAVTFKGWQYNVTLTVWSGTGQSANAYLVILVNDTEKPTSSFQVLNSAGKPVSGSGVVTASNLTAKVQLNGANATDPHNGSITKYYWLVTNSGNSSVHLGSNVTAVKPYPTFWLPAQLKAYTVNLTVWDLNGNRGWATQALSVSPNATIAPIMASNNLTASSTFNAGTSYTIWVNFTSQGGSKSVAQNVSVAFYLTSPSGTARTYIGGSPSSVKFYNYSGGVVNSEPFATGLVPSMAYNTTYRAEITWTPGATGNYVLYANTTAQNEYFGSYINGPQTVTKSVTVNPNPTTTLLEYVAIGVAVVVVIALIYLFYRRRTGRSGGARSGRAGADRGRSRPADKDEDEEDEDDES